ncbi:hypothetical protein BT96DRAFT_1022952 [Gymnopus androsaceus JB14]|uniref:Uncharacterized protein n=1 Tax=Gymnopus androsaceus JB14 TaxID=1447944 RepID=A0A6A4H682_9AGAR|nr:hypothetical protein BT96DRAFT_1022952 [Gymnopus androsaceus JB14]
MHPRPATHRNRSSDTATPAVNSLPQILPATVNQAQPVTTIALLQAGNGMSLQGKHDAHPAAPVMPAPRCTSDQVQLEQQQKAAMVAARDKAISNTAQLEDQMRMDDIKADETANHPPPNLQKKKTTEFSSAVKNQSQVADPQSAKNHSQGETIVTPVVPVKERKAKRKQTETMKATQEPTRLISEELTKAASDDIDGDTFEFDLDTGLNDSSDEGKPPAKKSRMKKAKKGALHASVSGKRAKHPEAEHGKVDASELPSKKPKTASQGLQLGWNSGDVTPSKPPTHPTLDLEADSSIEFNIGGFGNEDAGSERLRMIGNSAKPIKIKNIAAVVQTPSILKDIRLRDLPKEVQEAFKKIFAPIIIEFCGCIEAWTSPTVSDIQELWESTMPERIHDQFSELNAGKVVEVLVQDKLTTWCNNIGKAALKTLKDIFTRQNVNSVDQRRAYVAQQMTGTFKSYHYYYSVAIGEGESIQYAGAFQSYIISKTFTKHLKAIDSIPLAKCIADQPAGALVLAILAVHCALTFYSTGCEVVPIGSDGHFSQAVWGNKSAVVEGVKKQYKTTSNIHSLFGWNPVKNIDHVSAAQWDRIITTAHAHIAKLGLETKAKAPPTPVQSEPQSDEDWEVPDIDPNTLSTAIPTTAIKNDKVPDAGEESTKGECDQTSGTIESDGGNMGSNGSGRESQDPEEGEESEEESEDNNEGEQPLV